MSQNDYIIANQTAPAFRADLNDALQALASLSSGTSQPATTYANMLWYDTTNNILKMRTEANDAWMNVGYLDQTANAFRLLDDTQVVNTSGSQTGLIGDQTTATWETGTATTESLVSPAKVKAAIAANVSAFGDGQSWTNMTASRATGTNYTNTTGKAIAINIRTTAIGGGNVTIFATVNGVTFLFGNAIFPSGGSLFTSGTTIIPKDAVYSISIGGGVGLLEWHEMR
jgi:hypothetical protein